MKVIVKRAFFVSGVRQEPGAIMDVAVATARELIHMGKVEPADQLPEQAGPMGTESAGALVKGKSAGKKE
jgi:hypothetical protein